jgi:putative transposase
MVDDCTRECPAIEVDTSLGGLRVRRMLDRVVADRGLPEAIVLDNGPEFRGRALPAWSEERGVRLEFIQPGKPVQNAYVESFNGRLRDECLNANWFTSLSDARRKIETGGKITTSSARTVRWITCRPQNLPGHERRHRHEES